MSPHTPALFRRDFSDDRQPFALLPTLRGSKGPEHCLAILKDGTTVSMPWVQATNDQSHPACPVREHAVGLLKNVVERVLGEQVSPIKMITYKHHEARNKNRTV